jgi:hypothetical protein
MQHYLTGSTSSLTPALESILIIGAAATAAANKATKYYNQGNALITDFATIATAIGNITGRLSQAATDISDGRSVLGTIPATITALEADITSQLTAIGAAETDLGTGEGNIGLLDVSNSVNQLANYANARLNAARAYLQSISAEFQQITAEEGLDGLYAKQASAQIQLANNYLNQAATYMQNARLKLNVAQAGTAIHNWATARQQEFRHKMNSLVNTRRTEVYSPY